MIVIYGGAQVDAPDRSSPRFPEENVEAVERRIGAVLQNERPRLLVGAAASGADLLVLEAARAEGIATHIVLPFAIPRFVETSVASRGDHWRARFERLVDSETVEVLDETEDDDVYHRTNAALVERAGDLAAQGEEIVALVVRPPQGDEASVSDDLAARASTKGYRVIDIDPSAAPP